ncbi:MAG TPA: hypothetical protein VF800_16310 [Telluria sp.]|jgi:hypothetical protein
MSDGIRWRIYAGMCVGAVILGAWFFHRIITAPGVPLRDTLILTIPCIGLAVAAFALFHLSLAFKNGRVDAVSGSTESATLIKNGKVLVENVRLSLIREYDADDRSIPPERRDVIFICKRRTWVCRLAQFQVSGFRPQLLD